jgi:hypothetical protein
MTTQKELEELIHEYGLASYVYVNSEKEQFKIKLMSHANYITWRENPHQTALLTIAKDTNHKNIIKKLNHAKRMIDQERLRIYNGLTDLYDIILEKRQLKKRYEKLLTVLEQVRDNEQSNPWFLMFAQNQIYIATKQLDITSHEAHILKGISSSGYLRDVFPPMCDPLLTEQRNFHKISVDKTKLNRFIEFVKNEITEIEQYTK